MTTRVVLGDDSDVMRASIVSMLHEDSSIRVVGEASSFAQTVEMIADLKPDVLLLDLHLAEKRHFAPASVKLQLAGVEHVLAVSFSIDDESKTLAESYGAEILLDKMRLYTDLLPAIAQCLSRKNALDVNRKTQAA
jgi:chemotaxis response regulator CheB